MDPKRSNDEYNDEETARRRDEVVKRMINTPPQPHKEMKLGKSKPKAGVSPKKHGRSAKKTKSNE